MADNLFKLLEKAHETASTSDAKQFGVETPGWPSGTGS